MQIVKTIEEMLSDNREKLVIDVRDKSDYEKSSHPNAINIPWEKFLDNEDVLPKDKPIYLFATPESIPLKSAKNLSLRDTKYTALKAESTAITDIP